MGYADNRRNVSTPVSVHVTLSAHAPSERMGALEAVLLVLVGLLVVIFLQSHGSRLQTVQPQCAGQTVVAMEPGKQVVYCVE